MKWAPSTFDDVADKNLPSRVRKNSGVIEYQCPTCLAQWRKPIGLVDIRTLPIGADFACDSCVSDWHRRGTVIDGNPAPIMNIKQWIIRWAQALNAPPGYIAQLQSLRDRPDYKA